MSSGRCEWLPLLLERGAAWSGPAWWCVCVCACCWWCAWWGSSWNLCASVEKPSLGMAGVLCCAVPFSAVSLLFSAVLHPTPVLSSFRLFLSFPSQFLSSTIHPRRNGKLRVKFGFGCCLLLVTGYNMAIIYGEDHYARGTLFSAGSRPYHTYHPLYFLLSSRSCALSPALAAPGAASKLPP